MKPSSEGIPVKDLNHYGIIAEIIDEIGLVEKINQLVGTHYRQKVTPGLAVKAMIINGLGMFSAPLYLLEKFFEGKATEHLLRGRKFSTDEISMLVIKSSCHN